VAYLILSLLAALLAAALFLVINGFLHEKF
jgi:hypothetical protein